ncbi:MAG: diguanylate cyclase [Burkholderiaceae bacterium]|nr:diguanylate cyclase [Burkholderiaceae bacterium]
MSSDRVFGASGYASADIHLFRDIAGMDRLLADFPVLRLQAGDSLPAIVDGNAQLYAVLRGALRASAQAGADGEREALAGECVGEFSVMGGERRGLRIVATCAAEVLAIDAAGLMALIGESSGFAHKLLALRASQAAAVPHAEDPFLFGPDLDNGVRDRAWFDQNLEHLVRQAQRANAPLSMLMIHLDYVDRFAQSYGAAAVEEARGMTCSAIVAALRPSDFMARYSDNALAVLLPATAAENAALVAQRLRERMKKTAIVADRREALPLMASFGVASLAPGQDERDLIGASAAALARARSAGGSSVSI